MAEKKNTSARGVHVSPGIYTKEVELTYAAQSLGITTLGLVGETVKGPAFQPISVSDWREFQNVFGGTNPEKFKGSKYPKYELPYVAKSYLSESDQLSVVRVLGLGGYNAGPAWIIEANGPQNKKQAVAVLRSRGGYGIYGKHAVSTAKTSCDCELVENDVLKFYVGEGKVTQVTSSCTLPVYVNALKLAPYASLSVTSDCEESTLTSQTETFNINRLNLGRFKICGLIGPQDYDVTGKTVEQWKTDDATKDSYFEIAVSLNPAEKDYILDVLGTTPYDGDAPVFVESLYDVALKQGVETNELTGISSDLKFIQAYRTADFDRLEPINGIMSLSEDELTRKHVGMRFVADAKAASAGTKAVRYDYSTKLPCSGFTGNDFTAIEETVIVGQIYTVKQYTDKDGKRHYWYTRFYENMPKPDDVAYPYGVEEIYDKLSGCTADYKISGSTATTIGNVQTAGIVYNMYDGLYYRLTTGNVLDVHAVELDMNDYKSAYRYASTPWFVSNLKGDAQKAEVNKLFRFHTISDGKASNYMAKVSIENILPDSGTFDVVIRDINDTDSFVQPLERFSKCSMVPGTSNYIAYKIGSFDGTYESKSKYVTVEVADSTAAQNSVPCGFLGYPIPKYNGLPISGNSSTVSFPDIKYNSTFDPEVKNRRQYFGLSDKSNVDVDLFTFKGVKAYIENPTFLSHGFHLDSRVTGILSGNDAEHSVITVDGEKGYLFDSVETSNRTSQFNEIPIIGTEEAMEGSIYEYVNLRKFTAFFYGGFDGWDDYRDERSNGDNFKMANYDGYINDASGEGYAFSKIANPEELGLNQNGITSDWYAYLAGIRQFANPESVDINVFATPGIDYVNNKLLVEEAISMIEEERADSIYVVTTPDKPSGAEDFSDNIYTPEEAVYNLEDTEIDSNYTCTYYPWVKYLDQDNKQYVFLPPTKDVVRNMAMTDNTKYPWFAPAGIDRGAVECVRARYITKLADEDVLYEGRINPIKTFAAEGPRVWGQKNLQVGDGMLTRIAVRRLLLRIRKLVSIACIGLIFDQYDSTVKQSFISAVSPILDNIRSNRGISDYRIEVDDSIEARQNRELLANLYFKPYNALEYISVTLTLTPEGISFDDI